MANGILKDEATYFGDSEKYTGDSGSNTNMWVIEDTYDFIAVMEMTDASSYMRLVNDIDFNEHDIYKKGFDNKNFTLTTKPYLYGDGHKIKNMVAINCSGYVFPFTYVENVDFVNLVSINCNQHFIINGSANNCNFGIFFSNGALALASATYNDCTFNMKGKVTNKNFIYCQKTNFNRCHFNFDISSCIRTGNASGTDSGFIYGSTTSQYENSFVNCYFTGKLKDSSAYAYILASNNTTLLNCYFAFEYTGNERISAGSATYSTCFIDKELFEKNGSTWSSTASGLSAITTAQAQDTDYLNSIGFAVVPIE